VTRSRDKDVVSQTRTLATGDEAAHPKSGGASSAHARIVRLAADASSKQAFYSRALKCIAHAFKSPYAVVYVRSASDIVEDEYHSGPTDPKFWQASVQEFLTGAMAAAEPRARLLSVDKASLQLGLIAIPLLDDAGEGVGGFALVAQMTEEQVRPNVATLESLTALVTHVAVSLGTSQPKTESVAPAPHQALTRIADFASAEELAYSLTNNLRNKLNCRTVALGMVMRRRVKLLCLSGLDNVHAQSPGAVCIRGAMEECIDFGEPIVSQEGEAWSAAGTNVDHRLHKQWHSAARLAAVASIPLTAGDECVAVVSMQHRCGSAFTHDDIQRIRSAIEPFAAALVLLKRAQRGVIRHLWESAHDWLATLVRPRRYGLKITSVLIPLLLCYFLFGSMAYEVRVPCVVQPVQLRHVTAPYDAVLASVLVTAGDRVRAGDLLCELDHRDLDLQRNELAAELAVAEQEMQRAMAEDSPVEVRLTQAKMRLLQERLATFDRRIEQAAIRSPIDGTVIEGDLRESVGVVFVQGQPLFQVAPAGSWKLELEIPESAATDVVVGLAGRFASHARPETTRAIRIDRIRPNAVVRDNCVVFVAEADVEIDPTWMRPGMEGVAKVEVGPRPVWWVSLHRVIDYLRLHLWL